VVKNGLAVGAMSYAFMKCLGASLADLPFPAANFESAAEANPKQSYQQLLKGIREILRKNYSQKPQLSSSHKIVRPSTHHPCRDCLPWFISDRIPTYVSSYDYDLLTTCHGDPSLDRFLFFIMTS
jgi:hypothetical protein